MKAVIEKIKTPIIITLVLLLICGVIYPLVVTGISNLIFKDKARGSIIKVGDEAVGSKIVGQNFTDSRFMKGRPSAVNYNTYTEEEKKSGKYKGISSGSNNYAPSNPKLTERVENDMNKILKENPSIEKKDIPNDLVTSSGSGLDPHISPASAEIQIPAIAKATGLSEEKLNKIVEKHTEGKLLGVFGEETVNVLEVNIDIAKEIGVIK